VARKIQSFRHDRAGDAFRSWLRTFMRNEIRDHDRRFPIPSRPSVPPATIMDRCRADTWEQASNEEATLKQCSRDERIYIFDQGDAP
jgi:DNA-directed RNA polymerase specialized sigma24 family protein